MEAALEHEVRGFSYERRGDAGAGPSAGEFFRYAPPMASAAPHAPPPFAHAPSPYATPAGAYSGCGSAGALSAAQTVHLGGGGARELDGRAATGALRALQERVRALEAERAQLVREFEAQRASTLELEQQLRRARVEQEERVASLVGSLDAARVESAHAADAQGAQIGALRRELEHVSRLAQAAEADRLVAHAQLEALEAELGAQRADTGEHSAELEKRAAELRDAREDARARLDAKRAERASLHERRGRVEESLRRVLAMNDKLVERVSHPPSSAQAPAPQDAWPLETDAGAEPSAAQQRAATPRSRASAELARLLSHAQAELELAKADYTRLVAAAYDASASGRDVPQAPVLAALRRVEAKAALLASTRRALSVADEEMASARSALAQTSRALAKSAELSERRLHALHRLRPPEPEAVGRRLAAGHTFASAARTATPRGQGWRS